MPGTEGPEEPIDDGQGARHHDHGPDAPPTGRQVHAADAFLAQQDPADAERVAEHHREMDKIGAEVKGEGEIV